MKNDPSDNPKEEISALTIIQRIKDRKLNPRTLSKDEREQCVEALLFEGYSEAHIAQILERSQKTISRDHEEIRQKNALNPSPDLTKKMVGSYLFYSRCHHNHLMRLARRSDGSVGEKAQAEYYAYLVQKDIIPVAQSLGYLPQAPKTVIGEFLHHTDDMITLQAMKAEVDAFETKVIETGNLDEPTKQTLADIKSDIDRQETLEKLRKLESLTNKEEVLDDEDQSSKTK